MSEIYPEPSIPGYHPERTLPIGETRAPTQFEYHQIDKNIDTSRALLTKPPGQFQFFAAFDGTWNERGNLELSGNIGDTGVSILEDLIKNNDNKNFASHYQKGVGSNGLISKYIGGSIMPTSEVSRQAAESYQALIKQSNDWAEQTTEKIEIGITTMGFSRGGAAAILFSKLLNEHGIPDIRTAYTIEVPGQIDGTWVEETRYSGHIVPPGAKISALLVDPVATGVHGDLTLPSNIERLHVDYALNEHRVTFAPMRFSNPDNPDPRVTESYWAGAHSTLMNAYEKNGIGAAYLIHARHMLMSMGTPVPQIPAEYEYLPETARVHDSAVGPCIDHWVPQRPMVPFWPKSFNDLHKPRATTSNEGTPSEESTPLPSTAVDNDLPSLGDDLENPLADVHSATTENSHWVIADAGAGIQTDAGLINGYGSGLPAQDSPASQQQPPELVATAPTTEARVPAPEASADTLDVPPPAAETTSPAVIDHAPPSVPSPAELAGRDALAATNAFNTFLSTFNGWSQMSDLQRAASVVQLANSLSVLSGGQIAIPSAITGAASAVNVLTALESGNYGSAVAGCLQLADTLTQTANTAGIVTQVLGAEFVPVLNLALSIKSGNPASIVSSALATYGALNPASVAWTGPVGFVVAIVGLAIAGGERPPVAGWSEVTLDANGQLQQAITHSREGGGDLAQNAGQMLLGAFQQHLDTMRDEDGRPLYALNPARMPQVGYWYAPDGMQYQGEGASMLLRWVDERGETVTRFYDGEGNRADGSGESIGQDFARYAQQAVVPAWVVEGAQPAHAEQLHTAAQLERLADELEQEARSIAPRLQRSWVGDGEYPLTQIPSPEPERYAALTPQIVSLREQALTLRSQADQALGQLPTFDQLAQQPQVHADGTRQSIEVLTIPMAPEHSLALTAQAPAKVLMDLDGDGYLEWTDWVRPDQALLGIDLNADGKLTGPELLSSNLQGLDANGDGRLDAQDPAFRAIRLWHDANGDGHTPNARRHPDGTLALTDGGQPISDSEMRSLPSAGISAIVYGPQGITAERADGSSQPVQPQRVEGDVLGLNYAPASGGAVGIVRVNEQPDGSGLPTLIAANTRPPERAPLPPPPPPPPPPASPGRPAPPPPPHVNHDPVANDDEFHGYEDVPMEILFGQLLGNDWDVDTPVTGDVLRVTGVDSPVRGSVQLMADHVRFEPDPDFFGTAQFRYTISDGKGGSSSATAFLNFAAVNDPPRITGVTYDTGPNRWAQRNWEGDLYHFHDISLASGRVIAHDIDSSGPLIYDIETNKEHHPRHGHASIDSATGVWTYRSELIVPYVGPDPFTVRVRDSDGAASWVQVQTSHLKDPVRLQDKKPIGWSPPAPSRFVSHEGFAPVVLDLEGDGLDLLDATLNPVHLDFNGDGVLDQLGWVAPQDAFLAIDIDGDGRITRLDELSFVDYWPGALTDLEGLQAFDSNGDGLLSAADERWADFGLFRDLNSNGVQDEGEFTPLSDTGIVSISLHREGEPTDNQGNLVVGTSLVTMADGSTRVAGDVVLRVIDGASVQDRSEVHVSQGHGASADPPDTTAAQQALLFTSWCNAASNTLDEPALGFVPSQGATELFFCSAHDAANSPLTAADLCSPTGTMG